MVADDILLAPWMGRWRDSRKMQRGNLGNGYFRSNQNFSPFGPCSLTTVSFSRSTFIIKTVLSFCPPPRRRPSD